MDDKEIRVHTDKRGKDHIDVYTNDPILIGIVILAKEILLIRQMVIKKQQMLAAS